MGEVAVWNQARSVLRGLPRLNAATRVLVAVWNQAGSVLRGSTSCHVAVENRTEQNRTEQDRIKAARKSHRFSEVLADLEREGPTAVSRVSSIAKLAKREWVASGLMGAVGHD